MITQRIIKTINGLFSTRMAGVYILLFAGAIGVATFIENDYGTSAAQKIIFKAWWFEVLIFLFGLSILLNIFRFRMVQQRKWASFLFHLAILVIIAGAAITRYNGYEGRMHIREGDASNIIISDKSYVILEFQTEKKKYKIEEEVLFASLGKNKFEQQYQIGQNIIGVRLKEFIPNPVASIVESEEGQPIIKLVVAGGQGREEYILKYGEYKNINGVWFDFGTSKINEAIQINVQNGQLFFRSPFTLSQTVMATQEQDTILAGSFQSLVARALYANEFINFVIPEYSLSGTVVTNSTSRKMNNESIASLRFSVSHQGKSEDILVTGNKGIPGEPTVIPIGQNSFSIAYGSRMEKIPFAIKLNDFEMERYPGTNSASSYASEVTLIDKRTQIQFDQRIYMNHILNYGGYRFFQSSYDQDELGTVLSVNHDAWGTWITYLGYFLLTVGMLWVFFIGNSRFHTLTLLMQQTERSKAVMATFLIAICSAINMYGFAPINNLPQVQLDHAQHFGSLVVQDHRGRMKPMSSLASEVLRKIARKDNFAGQSAEQVYLGMSAFPDQWADVPMIRIGSHEEVKKLLDLNGNKQLLSYNDFFNPQYRLRDLVREAYNRDSRDRSVFDKEIIKIDERVNICNMIFTGSLSRLFPLENDPAQTWIAPINSGHQEREQNSFAKEFYLAYIQAIRSSVESNNWLKPNEFVNQLNELQHAQGDNILPSPQQVKMEILLEKSNVFGRLGSVYGLLGVIFLVVFFFSVFAPRINQQKWLNVARIVSGICFLIHTGGLALRWYVSGHAPWSNGYESMIYIAWTTVLAGLIFTRSSLGGLAATTVLASVILMVAGLSWMDPEITPLVPVLKSYWLTIHVSLEAGSYGFLTLGAIIGILNLILMIFTNSANQSRMLTKIREMTLISEMTLMGGLVMISIGTYLGGVWANESWGRYWGWDAKETWALVTILVYAFILHMRLIPGLRGLYAFNLASLFGFFSVLMTYFGVNYYLSGLHSYAAGDPVPIPSFLYYLVFSLALVSLLAYRQYRLRLTTNDRS